MGSVQLDGYGRAMAPETTSEPSSPDESVDAETIASRAGGRPPEERSSDDPEAQAKAILEESEERIRATDPPS
jgi:hypothetical protein